MRPNRQKTADLVIFTKKILNGKLHFLRSDSQALQIWNVRDYYMNNPTKLFGFCCSNAKTELLRSEWPWSRNYKGQHYCCFIIAICLALFNETPNLISDNTFLFSITKESATTAINLNNNLKEIKPIIF